MTYWKAMVSAVLLCVPPASANPGALDRDPLAVHERVLNVLFPTDVESRPYYVKLILRFHDDASQLALVVYPGGASELIRSSLENMNASDLFQYVSKSLTENPQVNEGEIAAKVRVRTTHFPVQYKTVEPLLNDLKAIRISPFLATRIGVDEVTWYDFWFDSGQESVHYKIFSDSTLREPQDRLARWMTQFRAACQNVMKSKSR